MLKTRLISAAIALPIFFFLLLQPSALVFHLAWVVLIALAAYEWAGLQHDEGEKRLYYAAVVALLSYVVIGAPFLSTLFISLAGIFWLFALPWILKTYTTAPARLNKAYLFPALGALLFPAFAAAVSLLHDKLGGGIIGLFILIWTTDVGAYFLGKRFGKTPFSPHISPHKTREGFFGGWGVALIFSLIFAFIYRAELNVFWFVVFSAIILVYASLGDLFESVLKRRAGVKDSGKIFPGHGGVLDRIDSWLPAMTLWAAGLLLA